MDKSVARRIMIAITLVFTILSFTFARANTLHDAGYILVHLFDTSKQTSILNLGLDPINLLVGITGIMVLLALQWSDEKQEYRFTISRQPVLVRWSVYGFAMLVILNLGILAGSGFIYAQF